MKRLRPVAAMPKAIFVIVWVWLEAMVKSIALDKMRREMIEEAAQQKQIGRPA